MFAVVLDTCVLWPSLQRDFLLSLAIENLYRPLWSAVILAELEEHEVRKLVMRGTEAAEAATRARRLVQTMSAAFDDALVEGWEPLEGTFDLPDPDDEHVVAAAKVSGAEAIVTDNIRDYRTDRLPQHLRILRPAQFAADTVAVSPDAALRAVEGIAARYAKPPVTVDVLLDLLVERYRMTEAVELLRGS